MGKHISIYIHPVLHFHPTDIACLEDVTTMHNSKTNFKRGNVFMPHNKTIDSELYSNYIHMEQKQVYTYIEPLYINYYYYIVSCHIRVTSCQNITIISKTI